MTLRILAPLAALSLVAVPAMAATGKAPAAKHHVVKKKTAKTAKTTKTSKTAKPATAAPASGNTAS
ncbi:MAG TPA: hypothetical protein VFT56_01800 [Sphingomonas sp.]|nr:hypothetical protein [Sphingomonas sp.]